MATYTEDQSVTYHHRFRILKNKSHMTIFSRDRPIDSDRMFFSQNLIARLCGDFKAGRRGYLPPLCTEVTQLILAPQRSIQQGNQNNSLILKGAVR